VDRENESFFTSVGVGVGPSRTSNRENRPTGGFSLRDHPLPLAESISHLSSDEMKVYFGATPQSIPTAVAQSQQQTPATYNPSTVNTATKYQATSYGMQAVTHHTGKVRISALEIASALGHYEVVKTLISEGHPFSKEDFPPSPDKGFMEAVLLGVIRRGDAGNVEQLLYTEGVDPNVSSVNGETALHIAVEIGQTSLVSLLLSSGVDLNARNKRNLTALELALQINKEKATKRTEIIAMLQKPPPVKAGIVEKRQQLRNEVRSSAFPEMAPPTRVGNIRDFNVHWLQSIKLFNDDLIRQVDGLFHMTHKFDKLQVSLDNMVAGQEQLLQFVDNRFSAMSNDLFAK